MKQYACLECGRVHNGKIIKKERWDRTGSMGFLDKSWHGYVTYRVCPECGHEQNIKMEKDKK